MPQSLSSSCNSLSTTVRWLPFHSHVCMCVFTMCCRHRKSSNLCHLHSISESNFRNFFVVLVHTSFIHGVTSLSLFRVSPPPPTLMNTAYYMISCFFFVDMFQSVKHRIFETCGSSECGKTSASRQVTCHETRRLDIIREARLVVRVKDFWWHGVILFKIISNNRQVPVYTHTRLPWM